jgi:hypothetical protein
MSNATTRETMRELLDLVGITRVIWIDDKFDAPPEGPPNTSAELIYGVASLRAADKLPEHELFLSLRSNPDQDERLWFESEIEGDAVKLTTAANLVSEALTALEREIGEAMVPELWPATATSGSDDAGLDGRTPFSAEQVATEVGERTAADGVSSAARATVAARHHHTESAPEAQGDSLSSLPAVERTTAETFKGTRTEYKEVDIEAIKKELGDRLTTHGLGSWVAAKNAILSSVDDGTLFLIDLEFKVGGENRHEGKNIAGTVLARANGRGTVIVLTHSISAEGAPGLQALLAQELERDQGLDRRVSERLMVVPKQSGLSGSEAAIEELRRWLRVSFTLRTCFDFVDGMVDEMKDAVEEARKAIRQQSVYHLDEAVFENSLREGALEFDVLARILLARQRVAAEQFLGKERIHIDALARLRRLRHEVAVGPSPQASVRTLGEWYRDEVFGSSSKPGPRDFATTGLPAGCHV